MKLNLKTKINLPNPINTDGHLAIPIHGNRGLCTSFNYVDNLDKQALKYAKQLIQLKEKVVYAADVGCSPYFPQAIRFAQIGLMVDAFDIENPVEEYTVINHELNNKINYIQADLKNLIQLPNHSYSIVYSNRFISHITYSESKNLLLSFIDRANSGCRFFLSFSSIKSVKGYYPDREKPIEERYSVAKILAEQHQLTEPVCLYEKSDIYDKLLKNMPIKLINEFEGSSSIKIIFSKI